MKKELVASLPLLSLLLLACRPVGPNYVPPRAGLPGVPPAQGKPVTSQAGWWKAWGDPRLDALVQRTLAESPDIRIAEARFRQARALQGVQEATGGPNLGATSRVSRDRLSRNGEMLANNPSRNIETEFTNYQIGFDASWELDLFGRQRRISEAALARTQASEARLQDVRLVLAAEVVRTYVEVRSGQLRVALAQAHLGSQEETVRLTRLALRAGECAELELRRAEVERSARESALAGLRLGLCQNLAALSVLTDVPIEDLKGRLGDPLPLPAVPEAPASGLPSDLLARRPDVRAAEREMAAASADIGVAMAERYPRFSLLGSGGWNSIASNNLLGTASSAWSVGPQLSLPIFNRGRLAHQVVASQAAWEATQAAYRKSVLNAVADVELALNRVARNEERRQRALESANHGLRMASLTERQVKAGEVSKLALLEVQRNLLGLEDQRVQAQAQSLNSLASLHKALGGGW